MRIRLYLDEDVPLALSHALLNRGVDVVTTQQSGNEGKSDPEQLLFATNSGRTIFTHNKMDFLLLNNDYLKNGREHSGIIVSDQLPIGLLLKRLMKLWFSLSDSQIKNRIEFLSNWK
jgi:hypothetical protein